EGRRDRLVVRGRKCDREGEQRRSPLALVPIHVADAEARLVVHDGADSLAVADGRVGRAAQVDDEGLVRLAEAVALDQAGDGLPGLAGGEGQGAARGLVVAAGGGGAVARGVGDGDRLGAAGGQGDGEGDGDGSRVPLLDGHVVDADRGRGRRRR